MESGCKETLQMRLSKLDFYATDPASSLDAYITTLEEISGLVCMTEPEISLIFFRFHQLRHWSAFSAQLILVKFTCERLTDSGHHNMLDKAVTTVIWHCCTAMDNASWINTVTEVLDCVTSIGHALSPAAARSSRALMWKAIEWHHSTSEFDLEQKWCQLGLHEAFGRSDLESTKLFQRRYMNCIMRRSPERAREIFHEMTADAQRDAASQFLLFKAALQSGNPELATECLNIIHLGKGTDSIIPACILEAQRKGDQSVTLLALLKLSRDASERSWSEVEMTAIFGYAVRQLIQQVEDDVSWDMVAEDICDVFERILRTAQSRSVDSGGAAFSSTEIEWFSLNAYNMVVKTLTKWPEAFLMRVIDVSLGLISLLPQDHDSGMQQEMRAVQLSGQYVAASMHLSMARHETNLEAQTLHYTAVRRAVKAFQAPNWDGVQDADDDASNKFKRKQLTLFTFDYEAASHLRCWDDLPAIVKVFRSLPHTQSLA